MATRGDVYEYYDACALTYHCEIPKSVNLDEAASLCHCTKKAFLRAAYYLKIKRTHAGYDYKFITTNEDLIRSVGSKWLNSGQRRRFLLDHWMDDTMSIHTLRAFVDARTLDRLVKQFRLPPRPHATTKKSNVTTKKSKKHKRERDVPESPASKD